MNAFLCSAKIHRTVPAPTDFEVYKAHNPDLLKLAQEHLEETERMAAEIAKLNRRVRKLEGLIVEHECHRLGVSFHVWRERNRIVQRRAREKRRRRK